jgi:alpha-ribazole phosphatase
MGVKFFLIRHGQTVWNKEGRYQGKEDIGLTSLGIQQAGLAAEYLSRVNISRVYSSPLKRALNTASIIKKDRNHDVIVRDNLREISFGKWEGIKFDMINREFPDDYRNWLKDPYNNSPTGGESFKDVQWRAVEVIENIINENEDKSNVAVITHGGVILSLLTHWLQIPPLRWGSVIQRECAINIAVIHRGFPFISAINYTGHLRPQYDENEDKIIETYIALRGSKTD